MPSFIVLSGCSGGGKSTLLAALAARGHAVVEEPGRRIVRAELESGGTVLPWVNPAAFAHRCITMALDDLASAAKNTGPVFFDRSLHDAAIALQTLGFPVPDTARMRPYARVILLPPWPEIRQTDAERRHSMAEAEAEYHALHAGYLALGYPVDVLPKAPVPERLSLLAALLDLSI